jgi:redox-sensitive bicupin YhaK (pirin superfamily)
VLAGHGHAGNARVYVKSGHTIQFGHGDFIEVSASIVQDSRSDDLEILILGGQPIREPIAWRGSFVMNSEQELINVFKD